MNVHFTDPGYPFKSVPLEDAEEFFNTVLREGGSYTRAYLHRTPEEGGTARRGRFCAWRPLSGDWQEGTFAEAVKAACLSKGFEPLEGLNYRELLDLMDEGMSLDEVVDELKKMVSHTSP